MPLPLPTRTRLEKAAYDNGFDVDLPFVDPWLPFASSLNPIRVWLGCPEDRLLVVAVSEIRVLRELADIKPVIGLDLPAGARGAVGVDAFAEVHLLLRRVMQLARSLPDAPLVAFQKRIATLPQTTEVERLVVQRVGQNLFRDSLLDYWEGRCAISGLAVPELLRASHIKAWADCERDEERLDVFNGFLLAAHLDAAFDQGLLTVEENGQLRISARLDAHARQILGLEQAHTV
ncbi:MAG TPA: HNH endonuclease signature motif containing protein, partial [Myxococcota bacterium]|nr:HNH endonuclease signature motif containing protein [Myxococcota bacterium]